MPPTQLKNSAGEKYHWTTHRLVEGEREDIYIEMEHSYYLIGVLLLRDTAQGEYSGNRREVLLNLRGGESDLEPFSIHHYLPFFCQEVKWLFCGRKSDEHHTI